MMSGQLRVVVAVLCLCAGLPTECSAKDPVPNVAKADAALADSAHGAQTVPPESLSDANSLLPAITEADINGFLAAIPDSIVPGTDVGNDRLVQWLYERLNGRHLQVSRIVVDAIQMEKPDAVHYARLVAFRAFGSKVHDVDVSIRLGHHLNREREGTKYGGNGLYYPSLSGNDALSIDSWKGKEVTVEGIINQVKIWNAYYSTYYSSVDLLLELKDATVVP